MDPIIGGSLIGAGASLLGGLFGSNSAEKANRANLAAQKEFAQHGIRWRVADAKAAGLHPLYALGAQTPSFSPSFVQDSMGPALAEAGQSVGRAVAASSTSHEKMMQELALRQAEAGLRETDARIGLLQSEAARNRMESFGQPSFPVIDTGQSHLQRFLEGSQDVSGAAARKLPVSYQTEVGNAGIGKGSTPLSRVFDSPGGLPFLLPGGMQGDASEALESLADSAALQWMVYKDTAAKYGPEWEQKFFEAYAPEWMVEFDRWFQDNIAYEKTRRPGGPGLRSRKPKLREWQRP